jgi:hypothetical protein
MNREVNLNRQSSICLFPKIRSERPTSFVDVNPSMLVAPRF